MWVFGECKMYTSLVIRGVDCGNIKPTTGHFNLFSLLLSWSLYTLYTVQFQITRHSLDLLDNVLHDWLFPHQLLVIIVYQIMDDNYWHRIINYTQRLNCSLFLFIHVYVLNDNCSYMYLCNTIIQTAEKYILHHLIWWQMTWKQKTKLTWEIKKQEMIMTS